MIERGQMCQGTHMALRFKGQAHDIEVHMPMRDRKFGILEVPYKAYGQWRSEDVEWYYGDDDNQPTEIVDGHNAVWEGWAKVPYQWAWGIYLGQVRKQNGMHVYIGYDEGYGFEQSNSIVVAMIALKGANNGVVLMYAPFDKLKVMDE